MEQKISLKTKNCLKRLFDVIIILVFAPVFSIIFLFTLLFVFFSLGKPVFFRQERVGLREKNFFLYKFRTMTFDTDAEGDLLEDKLRLTKAGKFLRKSSLDEIPQLFNVIKGDMSLIGPRPLPAKYLKYYQEHEKVRHHVRPGITGLAQIRGRNGLLWDARLLLDKEYVDNLSIRLDLSILIMTIKQVWKSSGVSVVAGESGEPLDTVRSYPVIDQLSFRRFERVDIPYRVLWFNDSRIRDYMSLPEGVNEKTTALWIDQARKNPNRKDFTIYDTEKGDILGFLGYNDNRNDLFPEIYILIDPNHLGRGIGHFALKLFVRWLEDSTPYAGCTLEVNSTNERALRLYNKFGFETVSTDEATERIQMKLEFEKNHV